MITALFIHKDGRITVPLKEDGSVLLYDDGVLGMAELIHLGETKRAKTKIINIHPDDL